MNIFLQYFDTGFNFLNAKLQTHYSKVLLTKHQAINFAHDHFGIDEWRFEQLVNKMRQTKPIEIEIDGKPLKIWQISLFDPELKQDLKQG
jgi:hypothetical protein